MKFETYAENLRYAMHTADNPHGRPVTIREVANKTQYSYEHVRRAVKGEAVFGKEANEIICDFLGLPADEMLRLAKREKYAKVVGEEPLPELQDPEGQQLQQLWGDLDKKGREMVVSLVQGWITAHHGTSRMMSLAR